MLINRDILSRSYRKVDFREAFAVAAGTLYLEPFLTFSILDCPVLGPRGPLLVDGPHQPTIRRHDLSVKEH